MDNLLLLTDALNDLEEVQKLKKLEDIVLNNPKYSELYKTYVKEQKRAVKSGSNPDEFNSNSKEILLSNPIITEYLNSVEDVDNILLSIQKIIEYNIK